MRRRIAFIDYFPPHYRRGLYEELARRTEADFYFFSDERERWHNSAISAEREGDYRVVELRKVRIAGQAFTPGLALKLSPHRYDAVIKSLNGKLMLPLTFGTAKARRVPFVLWTGMWMHPDTAAHRHTQRLTEGVYRAADAIVVYGEHVKCFLGDVPGVDTAKVFVAGQAVNPGRFEQVKPRGGPEALFVGQFKAYKGVLTLLDAWRSLSGVAGTLRLVGNGPLEDELRDRAAGADDVEVVGHVAQDDLPAQLARARFLVLPSETTATDREPWGLVVNEAMHAGLPVIATDAVGAAAGGLVRHGRNGLIVPEGRPRELAAAMRRLLEDPDEAATMGAQAREDVRGYTYARMTDAFEGAVDYAIAATRAGPGETRSRDSRPDAPR
jgi:glycosyltransferase involved in cell wall biosynthesis